jgi:hypothetical protein
MTQKNARFHLYRYQLLPINRFFQGDLYGAKTADELIAQKNDLFREVLNSPGAFRTARAETATKKLFEKDDFILYRIAANRSLNHETKDFRTETIDNWPKILVVIWNNPEKQLIAVQHRSAAFQKTDAVIKLIFDSIEPLLLKHQLTAAWEPLFEKHLFWDLIKKNEGAIQEIEFEIITPNMANISGVLPDNLKDFARQTNSVRNKISISSDPSSSLRIDKNNPTVEGLVDYSSEGGGDISIRISGLKKKIHTSRTVKEVEIDEAVLQGEPSDVANILKDLLS